MVRMLHVLILSAIFVVAYCHNQFHENAQPGKFTCACGKSFKSKQSLQQHQAATGHGESMDELKVEHPQSDITSESIKNENSLVNHKARMRYISELEKKGIAVDKADKMQAVSDYGTIIKKIIDHVRRSKYGKLFSADVRKAGSYKMQTKVRKADEFDTNIVISIDVDTVQMEGQLSYIYEDKTNFDDNKSLPRLLTPDRQIKDIKSSPLQIPEGQAVVKLKEMAIADLSHLCYNGNLIPYKVLLSLHSKVKEAIEDLNLQNVKLADTAHGPALTITISRQDSFDISVDLVLSLPWEQGSVSMYGWPRKVSRKVYDQKKVELVRKAGVHLVPKGDETWSISFSRAEAELLNNIDVGNECRRVVIRILKYFLDECRGKSPDGLLGISSHLIKTQILWSNEKRRTPGYWNQENKDVCLQDSMIDMIDSLRSATLMDYFNDNINILANKKHQELDAFAKCLQGEVDRLLNIGKVKDEL